MSTLEKRREEFRKYLESQGVIDNLTSALVKLYETNNKPADAVKFLRKHMCESCPDDEEYEAMAADLVQANKKICELERELSRMKGNVRRTASEVDVALEKGFDELKIMETKSLLKKFLTKDVIKELKALKTKFKGNLLDCVQAGVEILDSPIGAFACDADAYSVFASLFNPLIEELHGFKKDDKQPVIEWGEPCKLPELDEKGDKIISIRMRCCRSVDSFPFAPIMSVEQYEEIMSKLQNVTKHLSGDLMGKFHALEGMDETLKKALDDDSIMFGQSRASLKAANGTRFWPTGRGIFVNEAKTFVIWCNEEDHLRLISMESSGNLRNAYERLMSGVTQVSKDIAFARDERLGFLTFSPENLGSTIGVSARLKLDKLAQKMEKIDELAVKFNVKVEKGQGNVVEVKSKKRLGLTEFAVVKEFAEAINAFVQAENLL